MRKTKLLKTKQIKVLIALSEHVLMVFNYYSWYYVNAYQLSTPTFYYKHECQDSLIQCSTSWFCVNSTSLNVLLFVMNNVNGSTYTGTVHQHFQWIHISRWLGDRVWLRLITERPVISTSRLFLPHDQIMTFDWMWTANWLFKRETVCGV